MRHRERLYARARLCRRELVVGKVSKVETLPGLLLLAPVDIVLSPQAGGRLGGIAHERDPPKSVDDDLRRRDAQPL